MSLTYILIDFENVQPTASDLRLIRGTDYRVRLFHGPHQNKFDADILTALLPLGIQVELFQCERKGKNALDFHIACCLGRLVQECEPTDTAPGNWYRRRTTGRAEHSYQRIVQPRGLASRRSNLKSAGSRPRNFLSRANNSRA